MEQLILDIPNMKRKELQALAKENQIKANGKNEELINLLLEHYKVLIAAEVAQTAPIADTNTASEVQATPVHQDASAPDSSGRRRRSSTAAASTPVVPVAVVAEAPAQECTPSPRRLTFTKDEADVIMKTPQQPTIETRSSPKSASRRKWSDSPRVSSLPQATAFKTVTTTTNSVLKDTLLNQIQQRAANALAQKGVIVDSTAPVTTKIPAMIKSSIPKPVDRFAAAHAKLEKNMKSIADTKRVMPSVRPVVVSKTMPTTTTAARKSTGPGAPPLTPREKFNRRLQYSVKVPPVKTAVATRPTTATSAEPAKPVLAAIQPRMDIKEITHKKHQINRGEANVGRQKAARAAVSQSRRALDVTFEEENDD